jgi:Na+-driven multidrug efflux pump
MVRFAVLVLVPVVAVAFAVRTLLVVATRSRAPAAAAAVDRWWVWVPLVVVLAAITFVQPLLGAAAALGLAVFLTSTRATGSPFRPRR